MKLVYANSLKPVAIGDNVTTFNGEPVTVTNIIPPHKPESTGRVTLKSTGGWDSSFFPGVIGAVWIDREDQDDAAPKARVIRKTNKAELMGRNVASPRSSKIISDARGKGSGLIVYGAPGKSKNGHTGRKANGQFDGTAYIAPRCPSKPAKMTAAEQESADQALFRKYRNMR